MYDRKNWVWEGYIAEGLLTLLVGDGLIRHLTGRLVGEMFDPQSQPMQQLGLTVHTARTLVVADEDSPDWIKTLEIFRGLRVGQHFVLGQWSPSPRTNTAGREKANNRLLEYVRQEGEEFVIFDLFKDKFWRAHNSVEEVMALELFEQLKQRGVGVLLLDYAYRSPSTPNDIGDQVRNACDVILEFRRISPIGEPKLIYALNAQKGLSNTPREIITHFGNVSYEA